MPQQEPAPPPPPPRQDYRMGTFDDGMYMDSGPDRNTVMEVKPAPKPDSENKTSPDVNIEVYVPVRPGQQQ